jgi:hypothetical protein
MKLLLSILFVILGLHRHEPNMIATFYYRIASNDLGKTCKCTICYVFKTGISPNLSLAAPNGTNLTWSTLPPAIQLAGLWGGAAAVPWNSPHSISHALTDIVIGWLPVAHTWNGNFPPLAARRDSVESWISRVDGSIASCQVTVGRRVLSLVWLSVYES